VFAAIESGLKLPWRKHYSVLDFLTGRAFVVNYLVKLATRRLLDRVAGRRNIVRTANIPISASVCLSIIREFRQIDRS
jgi:hypothetical protein